MKAILIRDHHTVDTVIGFDSSEYDYFYNPWHYHPEFELTLIVKSYGQRQVGDSIENFSSGDIVLVGQNLPHVWKSDEAFFKNNDQLKAQAVVVKFLPDFAGAGFLDKPVFQEIRAILFEKAAHGLRLNGPLRSKVEKMMLKLIGMSEIERLIQLISILHVISKSKNMELLASVGYRNSNAKNNHRVNKVLDYLMDHYQENITLEVIAGVVNMNKNAFCRFFKKSTRKNLFTVLNEVRISKACQHLVETELDILQVCYANGFNNISNFNKAFKKITGTSPMNYRRKSKA
jgi:AraC-like DNA-binding protein